MGDSQEFSAWQAIYWFPISKGNHGIWQLTDYVMAGGPYPRDPTALIQLARAGDQSALASLVDRHRPYLKLLARLKIDPSLQARMDDSDLVQDTCLAAYRDFARFRGTAEVEFTGWLREIMAHVAANQLRDHRRQRRDVRLERRMHEVFNQSSQRMEYALAADSSSPSQSAERRENAVLLADALSQLPAEYREIIILRDLEGRSLAEIADRMGRTVNAVQKLWARAVIHLRRQLGSVWKTL